eukprot:UN18107
MIIRNHPTTENIFEITFSKTSTWIWLFLDGLSEKIDKKSIFQKVSLMFTIR